MWDRHEDERDEHGEKIGESRDRKDWLGRDYKEYRDKDGHKAGESRDKTDAFGRSYTEYRDETGRKIGESRQHTNVFGRTSTKSSGETPLSRRDVSSSESTPYADPFSYDSGATARAQRSSASGSRGCLQTALIALVIGGVLLCSMPQLMFVLSMFSGRFSAGPVSMPMPSQAIESAPTAMVSQATLAPTDSASDLELHIGGSATIVTNGDTKARLRKSPGIAGTVLTGLSSNTLVGISAGPEYADGIRWWHVQTDEGEGWVAESVLHPQQ